MSNLENIDIKSHVIESIVEVFDTMVSIQIEHSDTEPQDTGDAGRVVVAVNFSGNIDGILNIQVPTDLARLMTANKLDMKPEELEGDGEIKDLLSEVSNIAGGNLKSALNDAGIDCVLSTPSMTYEGDFTIKSLNMERFERFVFRHQQDWIFVEVGLKTQQVDQSPTAAQAPKSSEDVDLDLLLDIPLEIKVELGRAKIQIQELLKLAPGSAVKLIKLEGEPVDILANETLIAKGEVVVQKEKYGIRVTEITTRLDRIKRFGI
ncbi:flagellar motor switch protein FliN [Thermodesulfobacteriota bacterium]